MAMKLTFIVLLALAVVMVTASTRFQDFIQPRGSCIKPCQKDCKGSDFNCCMYKNTGKRGRCRTVRGTYRNPVYQCVHPNLHYVTPDKMVNDDCNSG